MSADSEQLMAAMIARYAKANADFADLDKLLDHEGGDPDWSTQIESAIAASFRAHAEGFDGLELGTPRCSATVCSMTALVRPGFSADAPEADFQTLQGRSVFAEKWFRDNFIDVTLLTVPDSNGVLHISYYIRK